MHVAFINRRIFHIIIMINRLDMGFEFLALDAQPYGGAGSQPMPHFARWPLGRWHIGCWCVGSIFP